MARRLDRRRRGSHAEGLGEGVRRIGQQLAGRDRRLTQGRDGRMRDFIELVQHARSRRPLLFVLTAGRSRNRPIIAQLARFESYAFLRRRTSSPVIFAKVAPLWRNESNFPESGFQVETGRVAAPPQRLSPINKRAAAQHPSLAW